MSFSESWRLPIYRVRTAGSSRIWICNCYGFLLETGSPEGRSNGWLSGTGRPKSGVPSGFQVKGWARGAR